MGFLAGSPKMPAPQPAPAPPTVTDPALVQQQQDAAREAAQARGRASTLLTSGRGVLSQPPIARKTLLGQ